jgi:hypothetical protein
LLSNKIFQYIKLGQDTSKSGVDIYSEFKSESKGLTLLQIIDSL